MNLVFHYHEFAIMETSQKAHTVESLMELINQNPDLAFEEMQKMPNEEKEF